MQEPLADEQWAEQLFSASFRIQNVARERKVKKRNQGTSGFFFSFNYNILKSWVRVQLESRFGRRGGGGNFICAFDSIHTVSYLEDFSKNVV